MIWWSCYDMYNLGVVLLTYNRLEYAKRTLQAVKANLRCSGNVYYHIADDGSPGAYVDELVKIAGGPVSISLSKRGGYGANYNLAMQSMHRLCDYVLPLEDDWVLERPLDVDVVVAALKELGGGCVRLGYIGYTQALKAEFVRAAGYHWLRLDPGSPEPHVFAGHPRIETTEWAREVGTWPEHLEQGTTEFQVSRRAAARRRVYWPVDMVRPSGDLFVHIGTVKA
jgi:glycosyltransferase involved in cell wall biosynthesis